MDVNVWTFVKQILSKDTKFKYDKKKAPAYILCLILSYDEKSLPIIQNINYLFFDLDDEYIYNYLYYKIPKGQRYIKYIKSRTKKEIQNKKLQNLMKDWKLSSEEIKHYKKLLEE